MKVSQGTDMECPTASGASRIPRSALGPRLKQVRPWIQTGFLAVWLAPTGRLLHGIPGCVFHCYSCPWSSFGCPVGIAANYAALAPVVAEVPWLLLGVLLAVAAAFGTLVCGWACPFGFLQDLLGKLTRHKLALPGWLGYMRYLVLAGLVVLLPWWLGARGIAYEDQAVSICRLCPAGALEAAVPHSVGRVFSGEPWVMSPWKAGILIAFVGAAVLIHRPWCRLVCPLGGWLAIFNRWSLFHLRFHAPACVGCNQCRSRCPIGVKVDQKVNVTGCVRCLECTSCGAVEPAFALPGRGERATAEPEHCPGTRG